MIPLTWSCDICHRIRNDDDIDVITYPLKDFMGAERNLKYCNDNPDCAQKAVKRANEQVM